jgi:hypothetical protein
MVTESLPPGKTLRSSWVVKGFSASVPDQCLFAVHLVLACNVQHNILFLILNQRKLSHDYQDQLRPVAIILEIVATTTQPNFEALDIRTDFSGFYC